MLLELLFNPGTFLSLWLMRLSTAHGGGRLVTQARSLVLEMQQKVGWDCYNQGHF